MPQSLASAFRSYPYHVAAGSFSAAQHTLLIADSARRLGLPAVNSQE
jgi:hypothetical protein